jgi:hypothetical protein
LLAGGTREYGYLPVDDLAEILIDQFNLTALNAVLQEWARPDADSRTRVGQLTGTSTGGLNGPYFLSSATIINDSAVDLMTGGSGQEFFFKSPGDLIPNLDRGEVVIKVR